MHKHCCHGSGACTTSVCSWTLPPWCRADVTVLIFTSCLWQALCQRSITPATEMTSGRCNTRADGTKHCFQEQWNLTFIPRRWKCITRKFIGSDSSSRALCPANPDHLGHSSHSISGRASYCHIHGAARPLASVCPALRRREHSVSTDDTCFARDTHDEPSAHDSAYPMHDGYVHRRSEHHTHSSVRLTSLSLALPVRMSFSVAAAAVAPPLTVRLSRLPVRRAGTGRSWRGRPRGGASSAVLPSAPPCKHRMYRQTGSFVARIRHRGP